MLSLHVKCFFVLFISLSPVTLQVKLLHMLRSETMSDNRAAIVGFYNLGKEGIPILIQEIKNGNKILVDFQCPLESRSYFLGKKRTGLFAAFIIEVILANQTISQPDVLPSTFHLLDNSEYPCSIGMIMNKTGKPILNSKAELLHIAELYEKWWDKNSNKPIEKLREDWASNKMPLSETGYHWE